VTGALSDLKLSASRLRLDVPDNLPALFVDGDLIGQAMKQLLDNADRYSPPAVLLQFRRGLSQTRRSERCRFGPGVKPDEQSRIFDKFYRGKHSSRFPEGTAWGFRLPKGSWKRTRQDNGAAGPDGGAIFSVQLPLSTEQVKHE